MTTIPHRELRNQSSKILERVKNGETIDVTNNGEIAATLIPPSSSPFERLLLAHVGLELIQIQFFEDNFGLAGDSVGVEFLIQRDVTE